MEQFDDKKCFFFFLMCDQQVLTMDLGWPRRGASFPLWMALSTPQHKQQQIEKRMKHKTYLYK